MEQKPDKAWKKHGNNIDKHMETHRKHMENNWKQTWTKYQKTLGKNWKNGTLEHGQMELLGEMENGKLKMGKN